MKIRLLHLCAGLVIIFISIANAQPTSAMPSTTYLFSYFVGESDGLHLAWSRDGLKWQAFMDGDKEKIFLVPTAGRDKKMRDPSLLLGPDQVFRLVWTDSARDLTIGYASSRDLLTWSEQQAIPVMKDEPTARNTWAPEISYEATTRQYLIIWSSTIPGRFPETADVTEEDFNHRTYATTTTDFVTFTPTTLFFDPKFCSIDATLLPFKDKFYLIIKNETLKPEPAKDFFIASSDKLTGPYTNVTGPIATQPPHWIEGPTAIQIGDKVILYYDCYHDGHFGACETTDMQTWTDITPQLSMPKGIRHGTVLAVPDSIVSHLVSSTGPH